MQKCDLKGSPSRDSFKLFHKRKMPSSFYACDLDLILVQKPPRIVAFIDFKKSGDIVQFSEVLAYNILQTVAPIYIIRGDDPENGPFQVYRYLEGNYVPEPPHVNLEMITCCPDWQSLKEWEDGLRRTKSKEIDDAQKSKGKQFMQTSLAYKFQQCRPLL